jgi:hypothetical protein
MKQKTVLFTSACLAVVIFSVILLILSSTPTPHCIAQAKISGIGFLAMLGAGLGAGRLYVINRSEHRNRYQ